MVLVLEVDKNIFSTLCQNKTLCKWRRLKEAFLSLSPIHDSAPPEEKDISDTFSTKFLRQAFCHPVLRVLQHPRRGCSVFGNVQELIIVAVIWRNEREGRKDPSVFSIQ